MDIAGQLADFPLTELLGLCVDTLINGALEVTTPAGVHVLFFRQGQLYHASAPHAEGFDAVWPLFELSDAPFRFSDGLLNRSETITDATPIVMQRAQTLAADWKPFRSRISSIDVVPMMAPVPSSEQVQISEEDWPILSSINGQDTLAEIAANTGLDLITVARSLLRLCQRGLVEIGPARPRNVPKPIATVDAHPAANTRPKGLFSKILATLPPEAMGTPAPNVNVTSSIGPAPTLGSAAPGQPNILEEDEIVRLLRTG